MSALAMYKDDNGNVWLLVPLVGKTRERLDEVARLAGEDPELIAASMLHDILEDDESAHISPGECAPSNRTIN